MMKKQIVLYSLVVLGLSGCNNFASPQGVVGTAYKAIQKSDLKLFMKTLTGDALEQYGDAAGMTKLEQKLQNLDVNVGAIQMTSVACDDQRRDKSRHYTVEILGNGARILDASVDCEVTYIPNDSRSDRFEFDFPPPPFCDSDSNEHGPVPGWYNRYYTEAVQCRISKLK